MNATYTYRADGLRRAKTVNGVVTQHVWNGMHIVADRNANGTVRVRYYRGPNGHLIRSTSRAWYLFNARGDVVQLTNANGVVTHTYRYDAFGNELTQNPNDSNPFRFAGEYFDSHRGEYYLRARTFNPRTGRFTQPDPHWTIANMIFGDNPRRMNERDDPLGLNHYTMVPDIHAILQAANLYVYCGNNPIMFVDPSGLSWKNVVIRVLESPAVRKAEQAVVAGAKRVGNQVAQGAQQVGNAVNRALGRGGTTAANTAQQAAPVVQQAAPVVQRASNTVFATSQFIPNSQTLFNRVSPHMFSRPHVDAGIMRLGSSPTDIFNSVVNATNKFSSQFVSGSNQIHTTVNGVETTIRFYVTNGEIVNINAFVGHAERVIGTLLR